jgi:predicted ester cyclase
MNRRSLIAGATIAATTLAQVPTEAQGLTLADRFAAALSAHDIVAFAALFSDNYVNHQMSAAAPPPPGPATKTQKQASVDFFAARLAGIPDLTVTIEAQIISADTFAASFVYSGTHGGVYYGVPPTGKPLRFTSCDIYRVKNGLIVEHWGMGDIAGLLAQLHEPAS